MNERSKEPRNSFFSMFIFGIVIGVATYVVIVNFLMENFPQFAVTVVVAIGFVTILLSAIIWQRHWILTKIFGVAETEITSIADKLKTSMVAAVNKDYTAAIEAGQLAFRSVFARMSYYMFIASAIATCIGLATAFSGLVNGAAITKQNQLIQSQMDFFKNESVAELRTQLDAILKESLEAQQTTELFTFLGNTLAAPEEFATEESTADSNLLAGRLFLLTSLRSQVQIERAVQLIGSLEESQSKHKERLVSISDYIIVSNLLYESGRFAEGATLAEKGINKEPMPLARAMLRTNIARIHYATGDYALARQVFDQARVDVSTLETSEFEREGFSALVDIIQAHKEADVENYESAKILSESAGRKVAPLPKFKFSVHWRITQFIKALESRLTEKAKTAEQPDQAEQWKWSAVQKLLGTREVLNSPEKVQSFLQAELDAQKIVNEARKDPNSQTSGSTNSVSIEGFPPVPPAPPTPEPPNSQNPAQVQAPREQ